MTRREKIVKNILQDLAGFIYENELEYGDYACLEACLQNRIPCPYGEKHGKNDCLRCIEEFLNKENE